MSGNSKATITFSISGIPETAGLRIKTLQPIGLYISCLDAEQAKQQLLNGIGWLASSRELIRTAPGEGIFHDADKFDWDAALLAGKGEIEVRLISREEVDTFIRGGAQPADPPSERLVRVQHWQHENGDVLRMVFDTGDVVDEWLIDSISADLENKQGVA